MLQVLSLHIAIKHNTRKLKYYRIFQSKFNTIHRVAVSMQHIVIQCNITQEFLITIVCN